MLIFSYKHAQVFIYYCFMFAMLPCVLIWTSVSMSTLGLANFPYYLLKSLTKALRWFLNDVISGMVHGEPLGCITQGQDVHGLIRTLHGIYTMSSFVAVLPYLMLPLVKNLFLRRYVFKYTKAFRSIKKLSSVSTYGPYKSFVLLLKAVHQLIQSSIMKT